MSSELDPLTPSCVLDSNSSAEFDDFLRGGGGGGKGFSGDVLVVVILQSLVDDHKHVCASVFDGRVGAEDFGTCVCVDRCRYGNRTCMSSH